MALRKHHASAFCRHLKPRLHSLRQCLNHVLDSSSGNYRNAIRNRRMFLAALRPPRRAIPPLHRLTNYRRNSQEHQRWSISMHHSRYLVVAIAWQLLRQNHSTSRSNLIDYSNASNIFIWSQSLSTGSLS